MKRRLAARGTLRWRRRRFAKKRFGLRGRAARMGFLKVVRKLPIMTISNTAGTAGAIDKVDPTGTCLLVGTPVSKAGYNQIYDVPFSMKFELNQPVNAAEFIAIADQYKILNTFIKIQSPYNVAQAPGGTATPLPYLEYIVDNDDNAVPNALSFREKMGVKTKYFTSSRPSVWLGVRPKVQMLAYQTGTSNGYTTPKANPWIDCADLNVPHYGIKGVLRNVWIPAVTNGSPFTFDVSTKVIFKDIQ